MSGGISELVAADIGGTNARFAIASFAEGRVTALGPATTLHTSDYASLATAWEDFAAKAGRSLPRAASIAVASPITGDVLKLTNNPWVIRPGHLGGELGLDQVMLVNDFGAVGHAVAQLGGEHFRHVAGPEIPLPDEGVISLVGPGTGLGVAHVLRRAGRSFVMECEGGHVDFAPIDKIDDAILARMRDRYQRVSTERLVSGPGLVNIHEALAAIEGRALPPANDRDLWQMALDGTDRLATAALERFCLLLGGFAGDIALAHGAVGVVIGGGVGLRIGEHLPASGFGRRFAAKGRMEAMLEAIPIKLVTYPQPGLFGAAAAFAEAHR